MLVYSRASTKQKYHVFVNAQNSALCGRGSAGDVADKTKYRPSADLMCRTCLRIYEANKPYITAVTRVIIETQLLAMTSKDSTQIEWRTQGREEYLFRLLNRGWNVGKAKEIMGTVPHEIRLMAVDGLQSVVARPEPVEWSEPDPVTGGRKLISHAGGWQSVDWKMIDQQPERLDFTVPLIATMIKETASFGGGETTWVIDGWNRIAAALEQDLTVLPYVMLSEAEETACRL
jgi:hypothetical protein